MNLSYIVLALCASVVARLPPAARPGSSTSLQTETSTLSSKNEDVIGDGIRHRKRKRIRTGGNRSFRRRNKHRNNIARRYLEKQLLVYNRTIALLGDEVEKILHGSKGVVMRQDIDRNEVLTLATVRNVNETAAAEDTYRSGEGTNAQDPLKLGIENALRHLLHFFSNTTVDEKSSSTTVDSPCQKWEDCKRKLQEVFLGPLPSCPCDYPSGIFYDNKIWDEIHKRFFHWRDASGEAERLDVYKPGAVYCIRSQLAHRSTTLSAQHCCYDKERKLITRGSGAGNPNYVSPDASSTLHYKVDILPWRICKGDFTRYNKVRPPNNGNNCQINPDEEEFKRQVERTTSF